MGHVSPQDRRHGRDIRHLAAYQFSWDCINPHEHRQAVLDRTSGNIRFQFIDFS
jgi:hypothetical protein